MQPSVGISVVQDSMEANKQLGISTRSKAIGGSSRTAAGHDDDVEGSDGVCNFIYHLTNLTL